MQKRGIIKVFYSEKMNFESNMNSSQSPEKPKKLLAYLSERGLMDYFEIDDRFEPFQKEDFYRAHQREYVDSFFSDELAKKYRNMLGVKWSEAFAQTTRYTNASLYNAILYSIKNPDQVCFSPTSGFHHATPRKGLMYCSFSGQVIASLKIYEELGLSGCYIDLDGHYGNSIDTSFDFAPNLAKAIPPETGNINITSKHTQYLTDLKNKLDILKTYIQENKIHYVVFCHGADSHEWDDLGRQLTTTEWIECADIVYSFIHNLQNELSRQIPVVLSLFGGYRKDDYNSVLSLHTADLVKCLNILCNQDIYYTPEIKEKS